jgi:hypothetical protein
MAMTERGALEDGTAGSDDAAEPAVALEAPEADAVEQRTPVVEPADEPVLAPPANAEADDADSVEQRLVVDYDEDDYR